MKYNSKYFFYGNTDKINLDIKDNKVCDILTMFPSRAFVLSYFVQGNYTNESGEIVYKIAYKYIQDEETFLTVNARG